MDSGYRLSSPLYGHLTSTASDRQAEDVAARSTLNHLANGASSQPILVHDTDLMFSGHYQHRGMDLVLSAPDGRREVIEGYFRAEHPLALIARSGAILEADIVAALAGPAAPGQYAQATPAPSGAPIIGRVVKVTGVANVIRNGVAIALNVGDAVQKGDVVQTLKGGALGIGFNDGTAFNLTSGTRMVLNDLVYDPAANNNSALFSVVQGQVSFVAGQVAHTGDMQVRTPVATMGIRGTAVRADINAENGITHFSVLREPDGRVGSFRLTDSATGNLLGVVNSDQTTTIVTPNGTAQVLVSQVPKTADDFQQDANAVRDAFAAFSLTPQPTPGQPQPGDQPGKTPGAPDQAPPGQDPSAPQKDGANQPLTKTAGAIGSGGSDTTVHVDSTIVPLTLAGAVLTNLQANALSLGDIPTLSLAQLTVEPGQNGLPSNHLRDSGETPAAIELVVSPNLAGTAAAAGSFTFVDLAPNFVHSASATLVAADKLAALGFSDAEIAVFNAAVQAAIAQDSSGRADSTGVVTFNITLPNWLISFLAAGQTLSLTYGITIDDHQPTTTITHYQTFVITGTNLAPVINLAASSAAGLASDVAGAKVASGDVLFSDANLADTHTVSLTRLVANWVGGDLPKEAQAALASALVLAGTDTSGKTEGKFGWSFHVPDATFSFLAAGEVLTLAYTVTISDAHGGSVAQVVQITVTGTNDVPVFTGGTNTGVIAELSHTTGSLLIDAAGGRLFASDADLTDSHTLGTSLASVVLHENGGSIALTDTGTLSTLATLIHVSGAEARGSGTIDWNIVAADKTFDFLGDGQSLTLTYAIRIDDGHGGIASKNVVVTVNGANDTPVIVGTTPPPAILAERAGLSGSALTDRASGLIRFTDADATDAHLIGNSLHSATLSNGGTIAADTLAALNLALTVTGVDATPLNPGTVNWQFSAPDRAFDFLGGEETVTLAYDVNISDGHGGSVSQAIQVSVLGANDAPAIVVATTQASSTVFEAAGISGSNVADVASGVVHFTDVDVTDVHTVTHTVHSATLSDPGLVSANTLVAIGAALTLTSTDATVLTPGAVNWQFSTPDKTFDFLSDGETLTIVYDVAISDGHGGVVTQPVTVTVTGTIDAPLVQVGVAVASTNEDQSLTFSHLSATLPPGEAGDTLSVTLRVDHGALGLGSTSGLSISADGSSGTLSFTGTQAEIDAALASGATFTPTSSYEGSDTLTLTATTTAANGAMASTSTVVEITVNAVAEAPVLAVGTGTALEPVDGAAIKTTLTLSAGETVSFNWDFVAHDYLPYNDFAFVTVNGVATLLSDVLATGDYGDTGWRTYQYVVPSSGTYTFGIGQVNGRDNNLNSHLLIDNLQVNGAVVQSFEGGTLNGWAVLGSASVATDHDSMSPTDGAYLAVLDSKPGTQSQIENFLDLQNDTLANIGQAQGISHVPLALSLTVTAGADSSDEEVFVTISGQPEGAEFNHGTHNLAADTWKISAGDLAGLTILTPVNYTGAFTLSITATAVEPENGNAATSAAQTLDVVILSPTTAFRGDLLGNVTEDSGIGNALPGTSPTNGHVMAYHLGVAEGFVASSGTTDHGTYSVNAAGDWVFTLNQRDAAVEALESSDTLDDSFTITAVDGVQRVIGISIHGANDLPFAVADAYASATDNGLFGELDVIANDAQDPDHGAANKISLDTSPITSIIAPDGITLLASDFVLRVNEATNKLTLTIGDSFRQLAEGETAQVAFTYILTGNAGDVSVGTATFDVVGLNEAPVIDLAATPLVVAGSVTKGGTSLTASGEIDFTDVDSHDTHGSGTLTGIEAFGINNPMETQQSVTGVYGTLTLASASEPSGGSDGAVSWNYAANASALDSLYAGQSVTETFTVVVADNHGGTTTQELRITLNGSGDVPVSPHYVAVATTASIIDIVDNAGPGGSYVVAGEIDFASGSSTQSGHLGVTDPGHLSTRFVTADGQNFQIFYTYEISQAELADAIAHGHTTATITYEVDRAGDTGPVPYYQTFTVNLASDPDISISSILVNSGDVAVAALVNDTGESTLTTGDKTLSFTPVSGLTYTIGVHADTGDFGFVTAATDAAGHITWNYSVETGSLARLAGGQSQDDTFTLTLTDSAGLATTQEIHVAVTQPATSPSVGDPPSVHAVAAVAGSDTVTLDALLNASDPQGSALTIDLSGTTLPMGIRFDPQTNLFTFDPAVFFSINQSASVTLNYLVTNSFGLSTAQSASFYVDSGGQVTSVDKSVYDIDIAENGLSTNGNYVVHGVLAFDQPDVDITSTITGTLENSPGTFTVDSILPTADPHRTLVAYTYAISQSELSGILGSGGSPANSKVDVNFAWAFGTLSQDLRVHLSSAPSTDFASAITANGDAGDTTFASVTGDETRLVLTSGPRTLSFNASWTGYHVAVETAAGDIGTVTATNDQAGNITWTYQVNEADVLALGADATTTDRFNLVLYDNTGHATTQQVSVEVNQPESGPSSAAFSPDHFYWRHENANFYTFTQPYAYFQAPGYIYQLDASVTATGLTFSSQATSTLDGRYFKAQLASDVQMGSSGEALGGFSTATLTITATDAQHHAASHVQTYVSVNPEPLTEGLTEINTANQVAVATDAFSLANATILLAASGSILFLDGPGSFDLNRPGLLSGFDQLVVSANGSSPGDAHIGLAAGLNLEITSQNTGTQFYLADSLYKFHGDGHGDEFYIENAAALHAGTVFDESVAGSGTAIHFTNGILGGAYDLTLASIHNVDRLVLDASNDIVNVDSTSIASFTEISGAAGAKLTTAQASLDLSHATISTIAVRSSATGGTAFTVASQADAAHIISNSSGAHDTLVITGEELSLSEVNDLFGRGTVPAHDTFDFIRTGISIYAGNDGVVISGDATVTSLHGSAGIDTFVFKANFGAQTVLDFTAGSDKLRFDAPADTADTLLATATQDVHGTTLHLHDGSAVLVADVTLTTLLQHPTDFIL